MNMKPKGILFRAEMIRALLNTKIDVWPAKPVVESKPWKWQTRRGIDPQPTPDFGETIKLATYHQEKVSKRTGELYPGNEVFGFWNEDNGWVCPHPVGSILYAKETHIPKASGVIYKADFDSVEAAGLSGMYGGWKPSIFMKTIYARLWFRVMNVRVERVNEISRGDAIAEGIPDASPCSNEVFMYGVLWDLINGIGDFDKGNYVWVYELARITKPV